jgi:hypothetical protein
MPYFVVVPGALVPASIAPPLLARAKLPRLAQRLQRAGAEPPRRLASDGAAHLDWLWSEFGGEGRLPVSAPYVWRALNYASAIEVPSEVPLWQADPVHYAFARDHMLVTALDGEHAVTADESRELAAEAATIVASFDATLRVFDASHWFLAFDPPWSLEAIAYDAALGRSAQTVLPTGDSAARWRKLLTEIQIAWHHHPVNEAREAADKRTINGLWLHGGGIWKALSKRPFETVAADDAIVRGWTLASGVAPTALLAGNARASGGGSAMVYWRELLAPSSQEDWDTWVQVLERFDAWFDGHVEHAFAQNFRDVRLILAGREVVRCIVIRPSDKWRFWKTNTIADLLAEAEPA